MSLESKLRFLKHVQLNGQIWSVFMDNIPNLRTQESYYYANTQERKFVIVNVVDDGQPFSKYLIDRFIQEAVRQYKRD